MQQISNATDRIASQQEFILLNSIRIGQGSSSLLPSTHNLPVNTLARHFQSGAHHLFNVRYSTKDNNHYDTDWLFTADMGNDGRKRLVAEMIYNLKLDLDIMIELDIDTSTRRVTLEALDQPGSIQRNLYE